ncbi:hypothetical protein [Methylophilus sp. 14]|uniref:hypothetical protein n=1 Tax=Methylophilus sp. 14 TaxID=2781019 RepID=UPI00188FC584|nr:hypothetical protein [Methylophilus sp. 14]MBF4988870.1 hypothetical protein [Methylophilus sp. 14]
MMDTPNIPLIDEFWPNPIFKFKDHGSPNRELIFLSVGRVCSTWEITETNLSMVFAHLVESNSSAAQRAYGVISTTNGRREALEKAAEIYHDRHRNFQLGQFNELMKHYAKASSYRNKIAHGIAAEFHTGDNTSKGCFLIPSFFSSKHKSAQTFSFWEKTRNSQDEFYVHGNSYRFTHEDIDFLELKFQRLNELLAAFLSNLIQTEVNRTVKTGNQFGRD